MDTTNTLTRRQLYELVWQTPMKKLAQQYGISRHGLSKLCARHAIPVPGPGHWTLTRKGYVMEPDALPDEPPAETQIEVAADKKPAREEHPLVAAQIAYEADHPIVVSDKMNRPHPLVAQARDATRPRMPGAAGALMTRGNPLPIRVSAKQIPRALRLIDTLFKAAGDRGYTVRHSGEGRDSRTTIEVHGEPISFSLEEPNRQTEHVLSAREEEEKRRGRGWGIPRYDYAPTGDFAFTISEYADGHQHRWSDGKRRRLEECLSEIVIAMVRIAVTVLTPRRLDWERQRQIRLEEERLWQIQRAKFDALNRALPEWRQAQELRAFIGAVELEAQRAGALPGNGAIAEWLAWATAVVNRTDPVNKFVRELSDTAARDNT